MFSRSDKFEVNPPETLIQSSGLLATAGICEGLLAGLVGMSGRETVLGKFLALAANAVSVCLVL